MRYIIQKDYFAYLGHSYIHQSLYSRMLDRYLKYFSLDNFMFVSFEDEFLERRDLVIKRILEFLEVDSTILLNVDIRSNPASKERSKTLKRIMKKSGWWRVFIKRVIPSLKIRQIIRNNIQRANISTSTPPRLGQLERQRVYNSYFRDDIHNLEEILDRDLSHWIPIS